MSKAINDGGPAFPNPDRPHTKGGMTLRDYFAAKAMQGELAAQSDEIGEWGDQILHRLAERSYRIADSMLAAREWGAS